MRKLVTFAAAFSVGIFLAQYLVPVNWQLACGIIVLFFALGFSILAKRLRRRILLIGFGLSLAFCYNFLYIRQVQEPMEVWAGREETVHMELCDYAVPTDYGAKVTVRVGGLPGKVIYYGEESLLKLRPGQKIINTVSFQSAARIRDEDETGFTSKGVFLLAHDRGEEYYLNGSMDSPRWWPARIGHAMRAEIFSLFEGDVAAFLSAILTGDTSGLSDDAAAALSEAGLYHILAVSGMHCGFLLAMVTALTGRHRRRLTAICALSLLIFYAILTGGSPSVLRACIMMTFLLAAPIFRRDSDGPTALSAALLMILLANPFAAASISLQLSFGAMAGMLFVTPVVYKGLKGSKKRGKPFAFTASGISSTIGALAFTAPLSACYFETLVLISPLSNLLCLWAAGVVFMLGLFAVLLHMLFPLFGIVLAVVPGLLAEYILLIARLLSKVPYHAVYFIGPYLKCWLVLLYLLFAAAWLLRGKRRSYAAAAGLSVLLLVAAVALEQTRYQARFDAVVLDVGQGQSVILKAGDSFVLVDCGSKNSWYDPAAIAVRYLRTMGCEELDYLILTHYDSDHVNGAAELMARMDVEMLLVPVESDDAALKEEILSAAKAHDVEIRHVISKGTYRLTSSVLTVFPPQGSRDDNEQGLSVLAGTGESEILITGDMAAETERALVNRYDLWDVEYLIAGHHGAKESTSAELLDALLPEVVCISVGHNSYGHPAQETIQRLTQRQCTIYRTDMHGHVHLSLN